MRAGRRSRKRARRSCLDRPPQVLPPDKLQDKGHAKMIRFYFHHTPNPMKVALLLEETGIPYQIIPVDTLKGEQHTPEFRTINPNGKTPAIVNTEGLGQGPVTVFDSNAILVYLAEKSGRLLGSP